MKPKNSSANTHPQTKNLDQAEKLCRKQLKTQPYNFQLLGTLGNILNEKGQIEEAIVCYKKVIQIKPHDFGSYYNLGNIYKNKGELDEALRFYLRSIELNPSFVGPYNNVANIYKQQRKFDEAVYYYQKAIALDPDFAGAYYNLAQTFQDMHRIDKAILYYQKTIQVNPHLVNVYYNLGNALNQKGQIQEAVRCYRKAIQINPNLDYVYNNLGNTLLDLEETDEAFACFRKAFEINPGNAYALANFGNAIAGQGKIAEAEEYYRHALNLQPDFSTAYSNLLSVSHYSTKYDAQSVFTEHKRFAEQYEEPLKMHLAPHHNEKTAGRRLKIGYISPDFRRHSVGYFIEPVLASHNQRDFEIFCYYNHQIYDNVTERMKGYVNHWRPIEGISDEQAAEMIRKDRIDICVDLAGHTGYNRILLFARKPAPVQVTWIGYPDTTGLSSMDYRIVDNFTDPVGMTEQFNTETLIRLPHSFLCYLPHQDTPEIQGLPVIKNSHITFGSFNVIQKLSANIIQLWSEILKAVPDSRLLIKAKGLSNKTTREYLMNKFLMHGIHEERIELLSWTPAFKEHMEIYNRVDMVLDTFPYNGTTNTCEALWMGVPVITLKGSTHVSRVGTSLLSNAGLPELIAGTDHEYIEKAVELAHDTERLKILRKSLREKMMQSPLTDAKQFTAHLEYFYRRMWETWCLSL